MSPMKLANYWNQNPILLAIYSPQYQSFKLGNYYMEKCTYDARFTIIMVVLKKTVFFCNNTDSRHLFGTSVLGDSLGSLGYCMFGQLPWKEKPHSGLDFPGSDG